MTPHTYDELYAVMFIFNHFDIRAKCLAVNVLFGYFYINNIYEVICGCVLWSITWPCCLVLFTVLWYDYLSFRCCECGASLSHWYYEKDGRLFCKKDYWAKYEELCHGCSEPITTGLIMVSPNPSETGSRSSLLSIQSCFPSVSLPQSLQLHHFTILHSHSYCARIPHHEVKSDPVCFSQKSCYL